MVMDSIQAKARLLPHRFKHEWIDPLKELTRKLTEYQPLMAHLIANENDKSKHDSFLAEHMGPLYTITDEIKTLENRRQKIQTPFERVSSSDFERLGLVSNGSSQSLLPKLQSIRTEHYTEHLQLYTQVQDLFSRLYELKKSVEQQFQRINVAVQIRQDADFTKAYLTPVGRGTRTVTDIIGNAADKLLQSIPRSALIRTACAEGLTREKKSPATRPDSDELSATAAASSSQDRNDSDYEEINSSEVDQS
jgi:hypothetical protein